MRIPAALLVAALVVPALSGCDGDDDCQIVCDKNVECQADSPGLDECLSICEDLAQDEGYAEALEQQAECYEDASCGKIESGGCAADFS